MKTLKYLGKTIQRARINAGLTQFAVSNALEYKTPQFVSNWERGESVPPKDALSTLKTLLGRDAAREIVEAIHNHRIKEAEVEKREMLALVR